MPNASASSSPAGGTPDNKGYTWINITDFTPGFFNNDQSISLYSPVIPAPIGSANPNGTSNCICLPQGGLTALPTFTSYGYDHPPGLTGTPSGRIAVTGFLVNHATPNNDEFIWVQEYPNDAPNYILAIFAWDNTNTAWNPIWEKTLTFIGGSPSNFSYAAGSCNPFTSRVALSNPTSTVGSPVVVIPWATPDGVSEGGGSGTPGFMLIYPNPNSSTSYGCLDLNDGPDLVISSGFGYQNRIFSLTSEQYGHPISSGSSYIITNEEIDFTDPPNSIDLADQQTVLVAEDPFGYSCVGSISAGELFMVKAKGGGLVVQGDIVNPNVTYLPGVEPGGIITPSIQSPCQGVGGFYYCVHDKGAWVWNGSNVSNKISEQIQDNFYDVGIYGDETYTTPAQTYNCTRWGDWIIFSNNWIYDTITGSWWQFTGAGQCEHAFWYGESHDSLSLFCIPHSYDPNNDEQVIWYLDRTTLSTSYTWQSNNIQVSEDQQVNMRECVLRYTLPPTVSGSPSISVRISNEYGDFLTQDIANIPTGSVDNKIYSARIQLALYGTTFNIKVSVDVPGNGATVVQSISLGYNVRQHMAIANAS